MARILLVDDDVPFRTMCRITMERMGHQVLEARNGAEAWKIYHAEGADLIVMDLIMPEREGLETIRQFRQNKIAVKILAISGGGRVDASDLLKTAVLFGADRALPKPFARSELAEHLKALVGPAPVESSEGSQS